MYINDQIPDQHARPRLDRVGIAAKVHLFFLFLLKMITYVDLVTSARLACGLLLLPVHDCEEPLSTVSGAAATVLCGGSRTKSSPAGFFFLQT